MKKNSPRPNEIAFAFFGSAPLATAALEALAERGMHPRLIVAGQDVIDRKGNPVFPPEKRWAMEHDIDFVQPKKLKTELLPLLEKEAWDVFVVAAYGKILPEALINLPRHGTVNMHPSLLPKLRGPSPIRSAILTDARETGVSVMLIDKEMDHGPLLAQKVVPILDWPPHGAVLDELLAREGAKLLAETLPRWVSGEFEPQEQDHVKATYCTMFSKEDGLLDLAADAHQNLLKIRAYEGWPGTYTFFKRSDQTLRAQIIDAHLEGGALVIDIVRPEGKRDMPYADFLRSGAVPISHGAASP